MLKYVGKRIIISIITIWVLITIVFVLVRLLPGDPFQDGKLTQETIDRMKAYYGLDKSLPEQYVGFMKNMLHGDLGYSLKYNSRKVNTIIGTAFPYSADLGLRALFFALIAGLFLGIVAALNRGKTLDYISMVIAVIGISVPSFVVGTILQYFFSVKLGILPVAKWESFAHTILPSFALGLYTMALLARMMRANMLDVIGMDYVKTAKSKGLSTFQIITKHEIRNSILPIITILGPTIAGLLTGGFVIEQIFAIPGLGRYYVLAVQNLDYSMTLGITIFYGSFLVVMNLLVDIAYGFIDPRIRVEK